MYYFEFEFLGTLAVRLIGKDGTDNSGDRLLIEKLEEIPQEQWHYLLTDFINSRDLFKVYFVI